MYRNLYEIARQQSLDFPKKIALIGERTYSYYEFWQAVIRCAAHLRTLNNIQYGDRVVILLPNISEYAIVLFALNKIGAVAVPVNIKLDSETIEYILKETKAKLIISNKEFLVLFKEALGTTAFASVEDIQECFDGKGELVDNSKEEAFIKAPIKLTDVAVVIFTSGTTGNPKGAMMSNSNLLFNCMSCKTGFGLREDDVHLIVVPLFHVTGLNSQLLASFFMSSTAVLLFKYSTREVIRLLKKHNVTIFIAVPAVFNLLVLNFKKELHSLKKLEKVGYAGAPMPVNTIKSLKKIVPTLRCYNFYGLTETSSITTILPDRYALKTPESVGIPVSGVSVMIVDGRGRPILNNKEVGELLIKGGNIVKGYLDNSEKSKQAIKRGWLYTGDIARIDSKKRIFLLGRVKEIINRGGEKVFPISLENKLFDHPEILEAAVFSVSDEIFGQVVGVAIVKKPKANLTKRKLLEYTSSCFPKFAQPQNILFLRELPRNANGKVQKQVLQKMIEAK